MVAWIADWLRNVAPPSSAWVGFTSAPIRHPLLGFAGFLQYFTATFHGDREEVELAVNGTYRQKPTHTIWTGSKNWSTMSFRNDELTLQLNNIGIYRKYRDQFNKMWNGWETHRMGIRPTCGPIQFHSEEGCPEPVEP